MYNVKIIRYINTVEIETINSAIRTAIDKEDNTEKKLLKLLSNEKTNTRIIVQDKERSIKTSIYRTKKSIFQYVRANSWRYFVTFTFNLSVVDSTNYDLVLKKFKYFINNHLQGMQYILIPERGHNPQDGKIGKIHFHGLFVDLPENDLFFTGHYDKKHRKIFQLRSFSKLGFSNITVISDTRKASSYIVKYISKDLGIEDNKKKYWCSRNLNKGAVERLLLRDNEIEEILKQYGTATRITNSQTKYNTYTYYQFDIN